MRYWRILRKRLEHMPSSDSHSVTGVLLMKLTGGPLSLLRSKSKYYFVLDEAQSNLDFYKTHVDFIAKRSPVGRIDLNDTATTICDNNNRVFYIHSKEKTYEFEAENEEAALIWMNCIQGHQQKSSAKPDHCLGQLCLSRVSPHHGSEPALPTETELLKTMTTSVTFETNGSDCNKFENRVRSRSFANMDSGPETSDTDDEALDFGHEKLTRENTLTEEDVRASGEEVQEWIEDWLSENSIPVSPYEKLSFSELTMPCNGSASAAQASGEQLFITLIKAKAAIGLLKQQNDEQLSKISQQELVIAALDDQLQARKHGAGISSPEFEVRLLKHQNRFLNGEIRRMVQKQNESTTVRTLRRKIADLEETLYKKDVEYARTVQTCISVPLQENSPLVDMKLYGGDMHRRRINKMLAESSFSNPSLPNLENLLKGIPHVDVYGFQHKFTSEGLALHYCCTQLSQHYASKDEIQLKHRWKLYLKGTKGVLLNNRQSRQLAREGIPASFRSTIWRRLVHQQVADLRAKYGPHYYKSLCSKHDDSPLAIVQRKQISVDLLRTMPRNVHFRTPDSVGIAQMHNVLNAFCCHNPHIGYCQGMNFIVGTALLFISPEDAFWLMVALTERYFVNSYFDSLLLGAQADQEVLKELMEDKVARVARHFEQCDVEVSSITLNWFLALFYDSVPFETQLRIWDCFLLEGPKVLLRFALAILYQFQDALVERSEAMMIMKILKAGAKYTYDCEGLFKIAFETLKPFPKRKELVRKQRAYLEMLNDRMQQKLFFRESLSDIGSDSTMTDPISRAMVMQNMKREPGLLVSYGQKDSSLAVIDLSTAMFNRIDVKLDQRILAMVEHPKFPIVIAALVSSHICAVSTVNNSILWETKLRDTALSLVFSGTTLFIALTNGYLAMIENVGTDAPSVLDSYYIPLGPSPLSCLLLLQDMLWVAMGNYLLVLNTRTMDIVHQINTQDMSTNGAFPCFERITVLAPSKYGIWFCKTSSSCIHLCETSSTTSAASFNICSDQYNNNNKDKEEATKVMSLLPLDNTVWVGTADGYVIMYQVVETITEEQFLKHTRKLKSRNADHLSTCSGGSRKASEVDLQRLAVEKETATKPHTINHHASMSSLDPPHIEAAQLLCRNKDSGYWENEILLNADASVNNQSTDDSVLLSTNQKSAVNRTDSAGTGTSSVFLEGEIQNNFNNSSRNSLQNPGNAVTTTVNGSHENQSKRRGSVSSSSADSSTPIQVSSLIMDSAGYRYPAVAGPTNVQLQSLNRKHSDGFASNSIASSTASSRMESYQYDDYFELYPEDNNNYSSLRLTNRDSKSGLISSRLVHAKSDLSLAESLDDAATSEFLRQLRGESDTATQVTDDVVASLQGLHLRRKDLDNVPPSRNSDGSHASSIISVNSSSNGSAYAKPQRYDLKVEMMLKVSDKPVKSLVSLKMPDADDIVISCAGSLGDVEAILRWKRDPTKKFWTNEPITECRSRSQTTSGPVKQQPQQQQRGSSF